MGIEANFFLKPLECLLSKLNSRSNPNSILTFTATLETKKLLRLPLMRKDFIGQVMWFAGMEISISFSDGPRLTVSWYIRGAICGQYD